MLDIEHKMIFTISSMSRLCIDNWTSTLQIIAVSAHGSYRLFFIFKTVRPIGEIINMKNNTLKIAVFSTFISLSSSVFAQKFIL